MCNCTSGFGTVLPTFTEIQKCAQFDALLRASYKYGQYATCIDVQN